MDNCSKHLVRAVSKHCPANMYFRETNTGKQRPSLDFNQNIGLARLEGQFKRRTGQRGRPETLNRGRFRGFSICHVVFHLGHRILHGFHLLCNTLGHFGV